MITIWHNPRCSKSRQTLALLQKRGLNISVRRYLDDAPTDAEINSALDLLGLPARALIRSGEPAFRAQGLSTTDDQATLVAAMAATPKLIERPVVFANGTARLGRPPEAVLDIV